MPGTRNAEKIVAKWRQQCFLHCRLQKNISSVGAQNHRRCRQRAIKFLRFKFIIDKSLKIM
jgi:predicted transposase YbfD/YdcC